MKNKAFFGKLIIIIIGCIIMAITDLILKPQYIIKSFIKIFFFLIIPLIYFYKNKDLSLKKILVPSKKGFILSLTLGIVVYIIIIGGYLIVRNFYDFSLIVDLLSNNVGVDKSNFIFVALYISFFNSLLEEFFFRGIAFLSIIEDVGRKKAYLFSAIMFSIYHIAIMNNWFSNVLFSLVMFGLVIGACIFNFIDEKTQNIYNSWMIHMFANFAINTIGLILFKII